MARARGRFAVLGIVLAAASVASAATVAVSPPSAADEPRIRPPAAAEARPGLAPHRAVYRVSLGSAASGSGVAGARGAMLYQFAEGCDGWTLENRVYLLMQYDEDDEVETTWEFASWEAKDGKSYRFRVRHNRNGEILEDIQGGATLAPGEGAKKGKGGRAARAGGVARFSRPAPRQVGLPPGSQFPTQHLKALLAAARGGERQLTRVVFDGSSLDNPYVVNAVIAKPARARGATAGPGPLAALGESRSWRMHLAFFPIGNKEPLPEYEIVVRYRDDGIAEEIRQDFGNFSLVLAPHQIEALPRPDC
jgi:hypothetical protein